jgi:hypothetical protein
MEPRMWVWKNVDAEREEVKLGRMKAEAVSKNLYPFVPLYSYISECTSVIMSFELSLSDDLKTNAITRMANISTREVSSTLILHLFNL